MSTENCMSRLPSRQRRRLLGLAGAGVMGMLPVTAWAAEDRLPVVATFSILGDMVKEVGGDRVSVTTIVGINSDVHRFEPTPRDAKALLAAKVLVLNGLDFEAWLPRLAEASGFKGLQVLATAGVKVRHLGDENHPDEVQEAQGRESETPEAHDYEGASAEAQDPDHGHDHHGHDHAHGDVDPHAWQNLANGMNYARNIAAGLGRADPRNAAYYRSRAENYVSRMQALDSEIKAGFAAIPPERRRVITSHDAFGYFGDAYGIEFIPVAGLSNQAEPSAADVARIVRAARDAHVSGIFIENMTSPKLAQQIARESGVPMGGTLYADALGPADEPAATYLGMFSWNAGRLLYVLRQAKK